MSRQSYAPRPATDDIPGDTRLTITWELRGEPSIEHALALINRWVAGELDLDGILQPLTVESVRIGGRGRLAPHYEFGKDLADRRHQLGLTLRQVADWAHLVAATVCRVEQGDIAPTSPSARAVRRALDSLEATR